ncbi:MAG: sugar phosphate isomerase/epimerase [Gemmataceae bacterium]|nr:sugar phosphate isomerase/epimerase [Gemmataceae bacterium]
MFVACSTMCFARYPLDRALRIIGELEFSKLDVAVHEHGPHLKPSEVVADVSAALQRIRIGPSLTPAAFSVEIDAPTPEEADRQMQAVCRLARMSTVSVLTIAAAAAGAPWDAEVQRLKNLVRIVETQGLVLTVATRTGTLTETPAAAVQLCEHVPGLGLTLDPSHYINGPHQGASYEEIFPYVRHVHLRDTGRAQGRFQVRVGQGEVEYGRIINQLERYDYERLLSVSIHDVAEAPFAMETEVRKLKYLLESLV